MKSNKNKLQFLEDELNQRKKEQQFRQLQEIEPILGSSLVYKSGRKLINFSSNDYLGLSAHPEVIKRAAEFLNKYGAGSTASRLVSGNYTIHVDLEQNLAQTFGWESALVFNSGFQANTTVLATIANRNSLILADKKVHNSLLQGAILSRAEVKRFRHNDYSQLEKLLNAAKTKSYNRILIVSETLFSMDGDQCDVDKLIQLSEDYNTLLYLDDAHAIGVFGKNGLGLNNGKKGIDISMGTFGKAFGGFGAFVGCSKVMRDYLINFCPGFIYSTALPPAVVGSIQAALELIPNMDEERSALFQHTEKVLSELKALGFETGDTNSHIIPVIIGNEKETIALSNKLEEQGILATAIRPPTVEAGSSRIRITLTAKHSSEDINTLLQVFRNWKVK